MAQVPSQTSAAVGKPHSQTVGLPDVPSDASPALAAFLQGVKELLETREGQRKNTDMQRSVIVADLAAIGLYDQGSKSLGSGKSDNTPPQPPRNLAVFQRGTVNLVTWTNPTDADLDNVEVWVAEDTGDINSAKLRGVIKAPAETFEHNAIKLDSSYSYWARAVDTSDNKSGWTTTSVVAPPGIDTAGGDIYDIFFNDLTTNTGIIRIREAIETIGAYYYETQGYYNGDVVIYGGYVYQCIKDNMPPSKPPTDTAYWKRYDSLADVTVAHETRLIQDQDQITLRATKAEVSSAIAGVNGAIDGVGADLDRVNSVLTATLSVQAQEISARVTKTDFYAVQQLVKDNAAELSVQANLIQSKVSMSTFDMLKGNVATVSSQVDQMADSWTVKIQSMSNGQKAVTGIDLALNDGTGQSQFIVLADNFRVAANVYGTPVGLFAVSGNGVYINGTLYAPGSIQAGHIAANSITSEKIQAGAITADKINARTITGGHIQASSIWADDQLINGSLSAAKIAAGTITADKIQAGTITADKIAADTIDARVLKQNGIPIDKIMTGVILQVVTGSNSVSLSQPGTHIYFASATGWGSGALNFSSGVGSQSFYVSAFWDGTGFNSLPRQSFATTKLGWAYSSSASWSYSPSQVNASDLSIVGIVIK